MRSPIRAALWTAALVCTVGAVGTVGAGSARAAVMTAKITEAGAGPYHFGYILGQDVSSMTLVIHKADGSVATTLPITDPAALTRGAHDPATSPVSWDGKINGSPAPNGDYYAEIQTTGTAVADWTVLAGPTLMVSVPGKNEARNIYSGAANLDPNSVFHNTAYWGIADTPAGSGYNGIEATYPDASSAPLYADPVAKGFDYVSATVMANGNVMAGNQLSKSFPVVDPATGTLVTTYAAGMVDTRTIQAFGSGDTARVYFVDDSSKGGIGLLDPVTATSYTTIIPQSAMAVPANGVRAMVVNKAEDTIFVSGVGYLMKFVKSGGAWSQDLAWAPPAPAGNLRGLALSPDEATLYVANNGGNGTLNRILAYDASGSPADFRSFYQFDTTFPPQGLATTSSGNIYITGGNTVTMTTSASRIAVLAPPDSGSSDATRSPLFPVSSIQQNITLSDIAEALTYHDATITWTTNAPANSTVLYGTTSSNLDQTASSDELTTAHSVVLSNLQQNTTYYYKVTSSAPGYNSGVSDVRSFTTTTLTISSVQAEAGSSNATITWTTSEPATTVLRYGQFSGSLDTTVTDTALATSHRVDLTGLIPGQTYYYMVESGWPGASTTQSAEMNFTTKAANLVTSEGFSATSTSATLSLKLALAASATVKYGTSASSLTSTASVSGNGTDTLTASFSGLAASTTYYYSVEIPDMSLGGRPALLGTFTTPGAAGTATTITQDSPTSLAAASAYDLQLGAAGSLVKLAKQGIPAAPVTGPDLPAENYYSAVVAASGYMYVIGGANNSGVPQSTVYYDKINADGTLDTTTGWQATTALPAPRVFVNGQGAAYNGYVYLLGGSPDGSTATIQTNVWYARQNADGTLGAWQSATPLPTARAFAAIVAVEGHLIVTGGFNGADLATDFSAEIRPDGSLGRWNAITPLDKARDFHRSVTDGRMVYALSHILDPTSTAYAPLSPAGSLGDFLPGATLPNDQYAMAAGLLRGKVVVAAGRTSGNIPISPAAINYAKIQEDGSLGFGFTTDPNVYPVEVIDLDAAAYNGRLYAAGGRKALNATAPNAVKTTVVIPMQDDPSDNSYAYFGLLESGVIDLGGLGNLQRLTVSGAGLTASNVEVRYRFARSTNGSDAPVFSDWFTTAGADAAISGGARYVQYQVALKGDGSTTPTVNSIALTASVVSTALPGDVDKNGVAYEKNDAILALKIAGGLVSATDPSVSFQNADVDGSGHVDMADATAIWRKGNGK